MPLWIRKITWTLWQHHSGKKKISQHEWWIKWVKYFTLREDFLVFQFFYIGFKLLLYGSQHAYRPFWFIVFHDSWAFEWDHLNICLLLLTIIITRTHSFNKDDYNKKIWWSVPIYYFSSFTHNFVSQYVLWNDIIYSYMCLTFPQIMKLLLSVSSLYFCVVFIKWVYHILFITSGW